MADDLEYLQSRTLTGSRGPILVVFVVVAAVLVATSARASPEGTWPCSEGEGKGARFSASDGVELYYEEWGAGTQTVVVPMGCYLSSSLSRLSGDLRLVFYDVRNRCRSEGGPVEKVSLQRQLSDLLELIDHLQVERVTLVGWSGLGMETFAFAVEHPDRVARMVQLSPVPPIAAQSRAEQSTSEPDPRLTAVLEEFDRGAFDSRPREFCFRYNELSLPSGLGDPSKVRRVPEVCCFENEWPANLWMYFGKLLSTHGDFDWTAQIRQLAIPRLVLHGERDSIPVASAEDWVRGAQDARLLVVPGVGHFPFLEAPDLVLAALSTFLAGDWPEGARAIER